MTAESASSGSRFWLVELDPDLSAGPATRYAIWRQIKDCPGVTKLCNLSAIDQVTLDAILRKPTPALKRESPSIYNAIRRYHQRKRQPRLLPDTSDDGQRQP